MKNFFFLLISCIWRIALYAQDSTGTSDSSGATHIIGINAVNFISQIANNYTYNYLPFKYFIDYRIDFGKRALRFGLGGDFSITNSAQYPLSGETGSSNSYSVITRFGFEWKKPIIQRWEIFYGIDQVTRWYNYKSIRIVQSGTGPEEKISISRDRDIGISAILGINLKINKKIYLGTETDFIITEFISEDKYWTDSQMSKSFGIRNYIVYPGLIWVNIKL